MKNPIDTVTATQPTSGDASFVPVNKGDVSKILYSAPARLLNHGIDEVQFPKRFVTKMHELKVQTLADMLRVDFESIRGQNLGERTIEAASEKLSLFLKRKIAQREMRTLREQMVGFGEELMAREARIWEMRMGLLGERHTLEAVGEKFSLTRERVRQIEAALFTLFSKQFNAVKEIQENAKDGLKLSELAVHIHPLVDVGDPMPLSAILENLDPKFYLVGGDEIDFIISTAPKTGFEQTLRKNENLIEEIFRASEVAMSRVILTHEMKKKGMDESARNLALTKIDRDGYWVDDFLLAPDKTNKTDVALGRLQVSDKPLSLDTLADETSDVTGEDITPENLRSALSLVPTVRSFGYGMVGFKRHVFIKPAIAEKIIHYIEGVVDRGPEGYQWNTKDFSTKVRSHFPDVDLGHHELTVVLRDSSKLQYLGRMTFVQRGEGVQRKLYREILVHALKRTGKPMHEDKLVDCVRRQRGFHPNVHMRNETEVIEITPKVWGLTRRDSPFNNKELKALTRVWDETFHTRDEFNDELLAKKGVETHGMRANEIEKIIQVTSE